MADPYTEAQKRLDEKLVEAWRALKNAKLSEEAFYVVKRGYIPDGDFWKKVDGA